MPQTLAQDSAAETHSDVRGLTIGLIQRFQKVYGGDFDEYYSQSNTIFMRAFLTYQPKNGDFTTWFNFLLWKLLLEERRRFARRRAQIEENLTDDMDQRGVVPSSFHLFEFVEELTTDARCIVEALFDPPMDLKMAYAQRNTGSPANHRSAIREFFTDLGWSGRRITESFAEIGRALVGK